MNPPAPPDPAEVLASAFARAGAAPEAARVMAAQLWKRAVQLAAERGSTPEEALAHLLGRLQAAAAAHAGPPAPPKPASEPGFR